MVARPSHGAIQALLGAFALDAVDGSERTQVEDHLVTCARCADEVREHREVASMLAHASGSSAPDGLWERIAGGLSATAPFDLDPRLTTLAETKTPAPTAAPSASRRHRRAGRILALAAAFAVLGGSAAGVRSLQATLADQSRDLTAVADTMDADDVSEIARSAMVLPGARSVRLIDERGDALADTTFLPSGEAYLVPRALHILPEGQTYQLWSLAPDGTLISGGVLGRHPQPLAFIAPEGVRAFALTIEANPGVDVSIQPRLASAVV